MTDTQVYYICQTALSALGLYYAFRAKMQSNENSTDIKEVRKQTNHIKDELVAATQKSAEAEGNLAGRAELKAEQRSSEAQIFPSETHKM